MKWASRYLPNSKKGQADLAYISEERGAVTIMMVVIFALMMGFIGLLVDVGRVLNVHSESGSYIDRVALTAAAELDGGGDSITRAIRAAVGDGAGPIIGAGFRLSLSGDDSVGVRQLTFLSAITTDPQDPYARSPLAGDTVLCTWVGGIDDCTAADSLEAEFVLVDSTTETENFLFFPIAAFLAPAMATEASVAPQALAGFTREVCNVPPLAICNPYESPSGGGGFNAIVGQQLLMKTKSAGAAWAPGNFGFLSIPAGSGSSECTNAPSSGGESNSASLLRCLLALIEPNTQCVGANVNFRPGQAVSVHKGLNARFDIWDPPLQNKKNNAAFAPSANVTKGKVQGANCTMNKMTDPPVGDETVKLPRDSCFATDTCAASADGSARFGNGITQTELSAYWLVNHGEAILPLGLQGLGVTRYDVYRHEIDEPKIPDKSAPAGLDGEDGNPTCSNQPGVDNALRDRRTLVVAVVNCIEHNIHGSADNVPVVAFMEMFLTEPIGIEDAAEDDIWAEVLGVVEPGGDDGILNEFPVLFR